MTHSATAGIDRRLAPRLRTSFRAELASGTVLASVLVKDLSTGGCRIAIQASEADLPDEVGGSGVLQLPALELGSPSTILAFVLRNVRSEGLIVTYGLEFRPMLPNQKRKLLAVMDAMAQEEAEVSP